MTPHGRCAVVFRDTEVKGDTRRMSHASGGGFPLDTLCARAGEGGPLAAPANGTVSAPSTSYGDYASYACNSGYQILGSTRRLCQTDSNWSGAPPTCGLQLTCGCSGTYYEGERVVAAVNGPSGATGVVAGQMGTVIAGNAAPSTLQVLIEWDGWTSGHDGNCSAADCGTCTPSPTNNRWYTACDQIRTARLTCSCAGAYSERDRAVAIVDEPAGASGILRGHQGTVISGNAGSTLGVLVEWDSWSSGHTGNCSVSDCGVCTPSGTNNRWYVECESISIQ